MGKQKHTDCSTNFPDSQELRAMTTNALDALREAQSRLHEEIETLDSQRANIDADQGQLNAESTAIREAQAKLEAESNRLQVLATSLQEQKKTMEVSLADLTSQQDELESHIKEFDGVRKQWECERDEHAQAVLLHEKRELELNNAEKQLNHLASAFEPKQQALDHREQELEVRASKLETLECELDDRRKMLVAMQSELELSQQTVTSQREELLARLGSIHEAPASSMSISQDTSHEKDSDYIADMKSPSTKPKPAASAAADQFRKLRRDAKRRAIGA